MKRFLVISAAAARFAVGVTISPAMAGSHPGPWSKIFGHSTSCALGRASTNDTTERGGGLTNKYEGCSASNDRRNVPPGYLATQAQVRNASSGVVCGQSSIFYNTTSDWTRNASTAREYNTSSCEAPRTYRGIAFNGRRSDAGDWNTIATGAGGYYFSSWLT